MPRYRLTVNLTAAPRPPQGALRALAARNAHGGNRVEYLNAAEMGIDVPAWDAAQAVERFFRAAYFALDGPAWRSWSLRRRIAWLMHLQVYTEGGDYRVTIGPDGIIVGLRFRQRATAVPLDDDDEPELSNRADAWDYDDGLDEDQQRQQDLLLEGMGREVPWFELNPDEASERFRAARRAEYFAGDDPA